jgi:tetratricopeptide (TPR) repeat protein
LFPFYTGEGNPYVQLADVYESRGQKSEAAAVLGDLVRMDEDSFDALKRLARIRLDLGDKNGAIEALKASFYIYPFDAGLHKLAGDVYLEQGKSSEAAREFAVAVALAPADLAGAHYDLARALAGAGKQAEARRSVLRALEIAPGFEKAQELLLKLRSNAP